jgi:hypothetical protein
MQQSTKLAPCAALLFSHTRGALWFAPDVAGRALHDPSPDFAADVEDAAAAQRCGLERFLHALAHAVHLVKLLVQ